jgi:hypothetical protein
MISIISRQTRPNLETLFYENTTFKQYVLENWILINKIIVGSDISEDGLTSTTYVEFIENDFLKEWRSDPIVEEHQKNRIAHNKQNKIISEVEVFS